MRFVEVRADLVMDDVDQSFWGARIEECAESVKKKSDALDNVGGFIDGTVIGIAPLEGR